MFRHSSARPLPPPRPFVGAPLRAGTARLPRPAFTLIELLTVIAILGILAAILIPTVARVRRSARQAHCSSNLRQIALAVVTYAEAHRDHLPYTTHEGTVEDSWINTLRPYLGQSDEVRVCPLDPRADAIRTAQLSSFALNDWLVPVTGPFGGVESWHFNRLSSLTAPARTFVLFVSREDRAPNITHDHTHSTLWNTWARVVGDIDPDRFRDGGPRDAQRLGGSAPYTFADAHVETIPAAHLKARLDAGTPFARPGSW